MGCFWGHVWKIEKTDVQESDFEQMIRLGRCTTHYLDYMMKKTCIVTSRCEKCGTERVKRI